MLRLILLLSCLFSCQTAADVVYTGEKLKGINLVAPPRKPETNSLTEVKRIGGEWIAIVPYGFCRKGEARFHYFGNRKEQGRGGQWWGETPEGVAGTIGLAREQGLKVMLKPHVWMMGGSHLDLSFDKEEDWQAFENDYSQYILDFARMADSLHVDLYCITTELDRFATARPQFWKRLIGQVRQQYKGKLTYAANWDRYEKIPFWNDLDYVGVDAYFPLSDEAQPTVKQLAKGWKRHLSDLSGFSRKTQKPILFTEFGYRSCAFSTEKPWESESACTPDETIQANAYTAFLESVWPQPWFAGGFVWKWFMQDTHRGRERDQFSPQGKAASKVLQTGWQATTPVLPDKR